MAIISLEILFPVVITFVTILVLTSNMIRKQVFAFSIQTIVMGGIALVVGLDGLIDTAEIAEFTTITIITISVKGVVIPFILIKALSRLKFEDEPKSFVISITRTVFMSGILLLLAYAIIYPVLVTPSLASELSPVTFVLLPTSFGVVLMGFYMLATGKKIYSHVTALLVMENGIYFASIATTYHMSFMLEIGILFDVIAAVIIMAAFLFIIQRRLKSMQVTQMEELTD
jgi:hydrogenase-4 component E